MKNKKKARLEKAIREVNEKVNELEYAMNDVCPGKEEITYKRISKIYEFIGKLENQIT